MRLRAVLQPVIAVASAAALTGCLFSESVETFGGPTMGSTYSVKYVRGSGVPHPEALQKEVDALLAEIDRLGTNLLTVTNGHTLFGDTAELPETAPAMINRIAPVTAVDYTGVKWSDGTVFDSSWEKGQPATFSTDGVVLGFKRALEGQTVGSQLLVSMPPMCAYGDASSGHALGGETLVFAIEIISTEHYEG